MKSLNSTLIDVGRVGADVDSELSVSISEPQVNNKFSQLASLKLALFSIRFLVKAVGDKAWLLKTKDTR